MNDSQYERIYQTVKELASSGVSFYQFRDALLECYEEYHREEARFLAEEKNKK